MDRIGRIYCRWGADMVNTVIYKKKKTAKKCLIVAPAGWRVGREGYGVQRNILKIESMVTLRDV